MSGLPFLERAVDLILGIPLALIYDMMVTHALPQVLIVGNVVLL